MYAAGYATEEEIVELRQQGYEVENAERFGLVGDDGPPLKLIGTPPKDKRAVVVFVNATLFEVLGRWGLNMKRE